LGYQPKDVKHVLPTHIHLDHAGSAWQFAALGAKVYLHPMGGPHMIDPTKFLESATRIYKEKMNDLWGTLKPIAKEQVVEVGNQETVQIGKAEFLSIHTPGHAKHHIAWLCEDNLFAGDVAGCRIAEGPVIAPTPPPDLDFEVWQDSVKKMESTPFKNLYITHYGMFKDLKSHFEGLKQSLTSLRSKSETYYDVGMQSEEMAMRLVDNFESDLEELAVHSKEDLIQNYQSINPLWMNAQGLFRYWQKKKMPKV